MAASLNVIKVSADDPSVFEVHLPCGRVALIDEDIDILVISKFVEAA